MANAYAQRTASDKREPREQAERASERRDCKANESEGALDLDQLDGALDIWFIANARQNRQSDGA